MTITQPIPVTTIYVEDEANVRDVNLGAFGIFKPGDLLVTAKDYDTALVEVRACADHRAPFRIVTDLNYPGPKGEGNQGGYQLFAFVQKNYPEVDVAFLSSHGGADLRQGLIDRANADGLFLDPSRIFPKDTNLLPMVVDMMEASLPSVPSRGPSGPPPPKAKL